MRNYVADLPGGTATTTVQIQESGTLKVITFSGLSTAAGKFEISTSPASQIGTAQPTKDVLARINYSGTAGNIALNVPVTVKFRAFDNIYFHQTGTGNLGSVSFEV